MCYLDYKSLINLALVCKKFSNCNMFNLFVNYKQNHQHCDKIEYDDIFYHFRYFHCLNNELNLYLIKTICICTKCIKVNYSKVVCFDLIPYTLLYRIYTEKTLYKNLLTYNQLCKKEKSLYIYLQFKSYINFNFYDDNEIMYIIYKLYNNKDFISFITHNNISFNKLNIKKIIINIKVPDFSGNANK